MAKQKRNEKRTRASEKSVQNGASAAPAAKKAKTSTTATSKKFKDLEWSMNLPEHEDNQFMDDIRAMEAELGIHDEETLRKFQEEILAEEGEGMLGLLNLADGIMKGDGDLSEDESGGVFSDEEPNVSFDDESDKIPSDPHSNSTSAEECEEAMKVPVQSNIVVKKSKKTTVAESHKMEVTFTLIEEWLTNLKRLDGTEGFRTAIKSNLNKLSEGNMDIILKQITGIPKAIYEVLKTPMNMAVAKGRLSEADKNSVNVSTCALWTSYHLAKFAHSLAIANQMTTPSLISTTTAFLGGCYHVNNDMALALAKYVQMCQASVVHGMPVIQKGDGPKFETTRFESRSAVQAIALAFDFTLVDNTTLYELIKFVCGDKRTEGMEECRADLLLILLKFADGGIKSLKEKKLISDIFDFINGRMPKDLGTVTNRRNFLLEEISKLRDPNHTTVMGNERFNFVRNWTKRQCQVQSQSLTLGWLPTDCLDTLIARAGGCRVLGDDDTNVSGKLSKADSVIKKLASSDKQEKLLMAAQALKLHSQVQQTAFIAMMGAIDEEDAVERILTSVDQKKDIPTAIAVIILVATKTGKFNPFYVNVLRALCTGQGPSAIKNGYKQALKKTIAAQLSAVGSTSKKERQLLGRVTAYLCWYDVLSLIQLRFIDLTNSKVTLESLLLTFAELLQAHPERSPSTLLAARGQERKTITDMEDICLLLSNAGDTVIEKLDKDTTGLKSKAMELKNLFLR